MNRALLSFVVASLCASVSLAGDLNPPSGPIAPTMKTLHEVNPSTPIESLPGSGTAQHVISEPGAYHLTGNMDLAGIGATAIRVNARGVTIDLNGFAISGDGDETLPAIFLVSNAAAVRNGTIVDWGSVGILANSSAVIRDVRFDLVRDSAIDAARGAIIEGCLFRLCQPIQLDGQTLIKDCVFRDMSRAIEAPSATAVTIVDTVIGGQNSASSGHVIILGNDAKLSNVMVSNEGRGGLLAGLRATVIGCTFSGNNAAANNGVSVGTNSIVKDCIVSDYGGAGITGTFSCNIVGNTISSCGSDGIRLTSSRGRIEGNNVSTSTGNGIIVADTVVVTNNIVSFSVGEGIVCSNDCTISGNTIDGDEIHALGSENTIDSNMITDSPGFSILVDGSNNRVTRNSISGNIFSGGTNLIGTVRTSATFSSAGPWDNFLQ